MKGSTNQTENSSIDFAYTRAKIEYHCKTRTIGEITFKVSH